MVDSDKFTYVTRQEYNINLMYVWLYIFIVIADLQGARWDWSKRLLELTALVMLVLSAYSVYIARRTGGVGGKLGLPASDRVKEIARDPARKIEAIKIYRKETGAGLAEAKEVVEAYTSSL